LKLVGVKSLTRIKVRLMLAVRDEENENGWRTGARLTTKRVLKNRKIALRKR
jgi:hypothetical protein